MIVGIRAISQNDMTSRMTMADTPFIVAFTYKIKSFTYKIYIIEFTADI